MLFMIIKYYSFKIRFYLNKVSRNIKLKSIMGLILVVLKNQGLFTKRFQVWSQLVLDTDL